MVFDPRFCLFVPGDRSERFAKAINSEATAAILDLEDAVAPERKAFAREQVSTFLETAKDITRIAVRINAVGTPWHEADLAALRGRTIGAAVLPKADDPSAITRIARLLGTLPIVALIESARGMVTCEAIAAQVDVIALAFGPYDLAADLGGTAEWESMLPHRARMLVAARAAGILAIDGPCTDIRRPATVYAEALAAAALGYDGKFLIHPDQIAAVFPAFHPNVADIAHARRVLEVAARGIPATLDGAMIDAPHVAAAERLLRRVIVAENEHRRDVS
ncbi:MAG TPA: CoA ester lyase [Candidatus Baltobacteraceae bacterium]|jgi:citrate lyase subunit beta/citryl-CoA lyase|nr:CoA ester lyase [Candidatus Baltobacteraceae bacterium]